MEREHDDSEHAAVAPVARLGAPLLAAQIGNRAFAALVGRAVAPARGVGDPRVRPALALARARRLARAPDDGALEFSDDPLAAGGFGPGDATIRVKPGPVRATLIRPRRLVRKDGQTLPVAAAESDNDWLGRFLAFFDFRAPYLSADPTGTKCMFNSSPSTLSAVIDAAIEQGDLDGHTITRNAVMDAAAPVLGRTAPAGTADVGRSLYLSFTFVPRTWHHDVSPGSGPEGYKRDSHDQPAQQFGGQVTWELHPKDQPGWEVSGQGQVAIFPDEAKGRDRLQSVAGGVQAALGGDLVDGLLQVAWINQALLGAARVQSKLDGIIRFQPVAQVATGGQFMFKIPGTDGRLQIGGQLAAQFTGAAGSHLPQTFDFTTGVTIQVQLGSSR